MLKVLESIELRIGSHERKEILSDLKNMLSNAANLNQQQKIEIFIHSSVSSDLCVHLSRLTKDKNFESELGLFLTSVLKKHGLVNYNVWVEDI